MNAQMQQRRDALINFSESRAQRAERKARADRAQALIAEVRRMNWRHPEFALLIAALAENAHGQTDADMSVVEGYLQEAFEAMDDVFAGGAA